MVTEQLSLVAEPITETHNDKSSANKEAILPGNHIMFHPAALPFLCISKMKHDLLK